MFLILVAAASAQSHALTVDIPFDFHVGNTLLNRGNYIVSLAGNGQIVQMSSKDTRKAVLSMSQGGFAPNGRKSFLMFSRYGDVYFLSQVYWADSGIARDVLKTKAELGYAKNFSGVRKIAGAAK